MEKKTFTYSVQAAKRVVFSPFKILLQIFKGRLYLRPTSYTATFTWNRHWQTKIAVGKYAHFHNASVNWRLFGSLKREFNKVGNTANNGNRAQKEKKKQ